MNKIATLLEEIREYEIEKFDTENAFKEDLNAFIIEKYDGDFSTFMKEEVLNEDYGSLRNEVERLYNK